ncbi:MAG: XdhC family protein [Spirochaetes bacterium]|uniref:XdhC family protein n=1 Tax=Candidatus Aphodenecus pullistercoris TaxID=2840669 RepID=A0A9D9EEA5_9SPIR|nr:XdhC family protein [Candidatus Aphodenecus pullistercoris]
MGIYEELAMRLRTEDVILSTRRLDDGTFEEWLGEGGEQVSRLAYPPHLVLFGGGHIAQALTPMAKACGIRATVVDDRAEVLTYDHFPQGTELIHSPFTELPEQRLERIAKPYYCIFTHGHSADAECLSWAGTRKSAYIGMIGSRRKIEACKEVAHARGVSEEVLSTIHSPIGLAINAVSPAEIAVAIMAEIISVYRKDKSTIFVDSSLIERIAASRGTVCRIVKASGSSPGKEGALMLIEGDEVHGTVGGGEVERLAIEEAKRTVRAHLVDYDLSKGGGAGMVCGGAVTIAFTPQA